MLNGERWRVNWEGREWEVVARHRRRRATQLPEWKAGCTSYASTVLDFSSHGSGISSLTVTFSAATNPFLFLITRCFFIYLFFLKFISPILFFFFFFSEFKLRRFDCECREVSGLIVFVLLDRAWHAKLFLWNFLRRILLEARLWIPAFESWITGGKALTEKYCTLSVS